MEFNKNYTDKITYKTETDSKFSKPNNLLPQGKLVWGGDKLGVYFNLYTLLYTTEIKGQGHTV